MRKLLVTAALMLCLSACSSTAHHPSAASSLPSKASATPTAPSTQTTVVTSTSAPAPIGLTAPVPGTHTLLKAGPLRGINSLGEIHIAKGKVWLGFSCIGTGGAASVVLTPHAHGIQAALVSLPIPCKAGTASPTMNQVEFSAPHDADVLVYTPQTITWTLRIQE